MEKESSGISLNGGRPITGTVITEKEDSFKDEIQKRPSTAVRKKAIENIRGELFTAVDNNDKAQVNNTYTLQLTVLLSCFNYDLR